MKKDFRSYLLRFEKTHFYRIKTITPIGDFPANSKERQEAITRLNLIEDALQKFDPVSIGRVKKTILQSTPLDFANVRNKEVYILDVELGLRVSPTELQHLLCVCMDVPSDRVIVCGEHDPIEMQNQAIAAVKEMDEEAEEKGLTPASSLEDETYAEAPETGETDMYGDAYNGRLLAYFERIRAEKGETGERSEDFNADIDGAPSAHPKAEDGETPREHILRRTYRDEGGKLFTLTRKLDRFAQVNQND